MLDETELLSVAKPRRKRPPTPAHPVLERLVQVIDGRRLNHRKVSIAAGSNSSLVSNIRRGRVPLLTGVERLAQLLGYTVVLKGLDSGQRASAWALKVHEEIVDVTLDEKKAAVWAGKGWTVVRLTEEE